MLSPGRWHLRVPKDPRKNLAFRLWILRRCKSDVRAQAAMREACKQDIFFWINTFVWQTNPKHSGEEVGPFITWEFQDDLVLATMRRLFDDQDDILWEKSREMGATWLALMIAVWLCMFHRNKSVLCLSHSEDAVYKAGNDRTLFAKVAFMLEHMPGWMTRGIKKRKLTYQFAGRSNIAGSSSTERSGVGDRVTFVLLDEFSKQKDAYAILGQTADTGPRLFIGTHYGIGTAYFELTQRPEMRKAVMHWSQHPEKRQGLYRFDDHTGQVEVLDKSFHYPAGFQFVMSSEPDGGPCPGIRSPWYDYECVRRDNSRDVAMHLDINPKGSVSQFFDSIIIRNLMMSLAVPPYWQGEVVHDSTGKLISLEKREDGPLRLWCRLDLHGRPPLSTYGGGCDLSLGLGNTNSCLSIVNAATGEKVAEYATPFVPPDKFALLAVALCRLFTDSSGNPVMFCWESRGPGETFAKHFLETGYRNIYTRTSELPQTLKRSFSDQPGWTPSAEGKKLLLQEYKIALSRRMFINRSREALEECNDFQWTKEGNVEHGGENSGNDPTGARTNHGDRVIADALAWLMCQKLGFSKPKREEDQVRPGSLAYRRMLADNALRREEAWV